MSIIRNLFILVVFNSSLYCQIPPGIVHDIQVAPPKDSLLETAAYVRKGEGNLYKGYFFRPYKFSGSLKQFLSALWTMDEERFFSNKMSVMEDSIRIDMEIQYQLRYSKHTEDMLVNALQGAYSFRIRDTILTENETVYVVKVIDESHLQKHRIDEHEFQTSGANKKYGFSIYNGRQLNKLQYSLPIAVKTKEREINKLKIPIVMEIPPQYDGLYNYVIPTNMFDENGNMLYFDTLLDINPVLFNYGLQVQKVTRPKMGKVIEFFDMPNVELPYRFKYKY